MNTESDNISNSMKIEDIFTIKDRGVIVVGQSKINSFKVNDTVRIKGGNFEKEATIIGIDVKYGCFGPLDLEKISMGILLRGLNKNEIEKGYYLYKE